MTDTIKDVMETLIEYANGGVSGLYPPEDDVQELVDYILDLQEEIERLHSIIKEALNYIDDNTYYKDHKGNINIDDLYIILQKGTDKE